MEVFPMMTPARKARAERPEMVLHRPGLVCSTEYERCPHAEIRHGQHLGGIPLPREPAVDALREVRILPMHAHQREGDRPDAGKFCHLHDQILRLRKMGVLRGLGLQDILEVFSHVRYTIGNSANAAAGVSGSAAGESAIDNI